MLTWQNATLDIICVIEERMQLSIAACTQDISEKAAPDLQW